MKKALIMVGEEFSANGVCSKSIMEEMVANGYSVSLVTNNEYGPNKNSGKSLGMIYRIKPRITYMMRSWSEGKSGYIPTIVMKLSYIMNKMKLVLSYCSWPLISPLYSYRFYRKAKEIYTKEKFDVIIPVYTQIDTLIAAHCIKKKYPDVKYVPYFLDSLSGGYGPKIFSSDKLVKRGLKWERRLLINADKIIAMESSKSHHSKVSSSERYFGRYVFLDIPLIRAHNKRNRISRHLDPKYINFVYTGSIPFHIRNPFYFLELFSHISDPKYRLTIIGPDTCDKELLAFKEILGNRLVLIGKISHSDILDVLHNSDFLVNFGNSINSMVPSKIFEYISVGRPVISTYSIQDDPCINYLSKYPISLLLPENLEELDKGIWKLKEFVNKNFGKQIALSGMTEAYRNNTPLAFVDEISKLFY